MSNKWIKIELKLKIHRDILKDDGRYNTKLIKIWCWTIEYADISDGIGLYYIVPATSKHGNINILIRSGIDSTKAETASITHKDNNEFTWIIYKPCCLWNGLRRKTSGLSTIYIIKSWIYLINIKGIRFIEEVPIIKLRLPHKVI